MLSLSGAATNQISEQFSNNTLIFIYFSLPCFFFCFLINLLNYLNFLMKFSFLLSYFWFPKLAFFYSSKLPFYGFYIFLVSRYSIFYLLSENISVSCVLVFYFFSLSSFPLFFLLALFLLSFFLQCFLRISALNFFLLCSLIPSFLFLIPVFHIKDFPQVSNDP